MPKRIPKSNQVARRTKKFAREMTRIRQRGNWDVYHNPETVYAMIRKYGPKSGPEHAGIFRDAREKGGPAAYPEFGTRSTKSGRLVSRRISDFTTRSSRPRDMGARPKQNPPKKKR